MYTFIASLALGTKELPYQRAHPFKSSEESLYYFPPWHRPFCLSKPMLQINGGCNSLMLLLRHGPVPSPSLWLIEYSGSDIMPVCRPAIFTVCLVTRALGALSCWVRSPATLLKSGKSVILEHRDTEKAWPCTKKEGPSPPAIPTKHGTCRQSHFGSFNWLSYQYIEQKNPPATPFPNLMTPKTVRYNKCFAILIH